jgi:hypothetical protein
VSALWLLIRLQLVGWGRFLTAGLRTVKGALLAAVGLFFLGAYLLPFLLAPRQEIAVAADQIRLYGPAVLLAYCLINALLTSGERAIYFTPAEINFLFAGPFGRRQVLAYKILSSFLMSLPTALLLALFLRSSAWWLGGFLALLLVFTFLFLFGLTVNQLAFSVGARLYTRWRKYALAVLLAAGAAALWWNRDALAGGGLRDWFLAVQNGAVWRTLTAPLRAFFELYLAEPGDFGALAFNAFGGLLANALLLAVIFWLDADYTEATAVSSARIYAAIQRLRGRREAAADEGSPGPASAPVRLSLPDLPRLGGVGPILWRQLTTALRTWGKVAALAVCFVAIFLAAVLAGRSEPEGAGAASVGALGGMVLMLSLFISVLAPFDFRNDLERMAVLKTLPLPAWRLALGQVLAPVLILSAMQSVALAGFLLLLPEPGPGLAVLAAFTLPVNFLLVALENLLFLLFPSRLYATPGDFQALGRNVLTWLAKMLVVGAVLVLVSLVGFVVYLGAAVLLGDAEALKRPSAAALAPSLLAAWLFLAAAGAALLPAIAWAFDRFDVGRDTPP